MSDPAAPVALPDQPMPPPGGETPRKTVASWAMLELAHWRRRQLSRTALEEQLRALAATHPQLYLFEFTPGAVRHIPQTLKPGGPAAHPNRPPIYLRLFNATLPLLPPDFEALVCLNLADLMGLKLDAPIFCFQRAAHQHYPLLPDVDFIGFKYHTTPEQQDTLPYAEKDTRAVFAGSTTGGRITPEVARDCSLPRLRAARFFWGNPKVDFRLPSLGKSVSPEVRAILEAYPFCQQPRLSWQEQFRNKFLLSMDGNGATCQRVAVALASQCVLVKYASPHLLYYFHGLRPWEHFIPVSEDAEVEPIIDAELREPGRHAAIAGAGRAFAQTFLTRQRILEYTAALLRAYRGMLSG